MKRCMDAEKLVGYSLMCALGPFITRRMGMGHAPWQPGTLQSIEFLLQPVMGSLTVHPNKKPQIKTIQPSCLESLLSLCLHNISFHDASFSVSIEDSRISFFLNFTASYCSL